MTNKKAMRRGTNSEAKKNKRIGKENVGKNSGGAISKAVSEDVMQRGSAQSVRASTSDDSGTMHSHLNDAIATASSVDSEQVNTKTTADLAALVNVYHQVADEARSRLREAISSQQDLAKKVAHLEEKYSQELRKSSSLEQSVKERFGELGILEKKIAELDALLEWEKSKSVNSVSVKSTSRDVDKKKLETLIRHWEERYEALSQENESVRNALATVSSERDALLQKVARVVNEQAEFNSTLSRLNKSIFDKDELIRREVAARLGVEREIERLKKSISWRVTWPIRMIPNKKKGGVGRPQSDLSLISLVRDSGYFDSEWYISKYPEVEASGMDALNYFCSRGLKENHDPGPRFSSEAYRTKYGDVARSGMPAFLHFVIHGRAEGRKI